MGKKIAGCRCYCAQSPAIFDFRGGYIILLERVPSRLSPVKIFFPNCVAFLMICWRVILKISNQEALMIVWVKFLQNILLKSNKLCFHLSLGNTFEKISLQASTSLYFACDLSVHQYETLCRYFPPQVLHTYHNKRLSMLMFQRQKNLQYFLVNKGALVSLYDLWSRTWGRTCSGPAVFDPQTNVCCR